MIVTIFGDVHGNVVALEKLFEIEKEQTDLFVCHGDVVNYGPWSNECVSFLSEVENILLLKGNHEDYFIAGSYPGENLIAKSFFEFCFPTFNPELLKSIEKYDDNAVIGEYKVKHTIESQYIFKNTDISNLLIDRNYIIGHSHQQYLIKKDSFKIFNTGSLGQNRQYLNQSCYLQLDTETNKMELKSFIHNIDLVVSEMKRRGYPRICIDYYLSKERFE